MVAVVSDTAEVFLRHLDLKPLRGRRRGLVPCIFQPRDRTPSLSIDLDKGVFHCHACGVGGGVKKFRELVGEAPPIRPQARPGESPLAAARRQVLADARAQRWADEGVQLLYQISDWIRKSRRHVDVLRDTVAPLGSRAEDIEAAHSILAAAASIETFTNAIEAELDDILADRRYRW